MKSNFKSVLQIGPALFCASAIALAGCARFHPQPLNPEKSASDFDARSLSNPALQSFIAKNSTHAPAEWPPARWDFDLLTLAAFYYQPSLEVARADWRSAEGATITAAARLNPSVSAAGAYDNGIANNFSVWQPSITFDIPLQTAGKRQRKMDQARWESESARLSVAQAAWQARSQLRSSLVDFVTAQRRAALLRQQSDIQKQVASRLAQQLQAGAVANTEVTVANIALARSAVDLTDAERQLAESRGHVAEAIGIPVAALDGVDIDFDLARTPDVGSLTSREARHVALTSRTDILAALADYAASQSALQLEIARQYPDVHITPGYFFNQGNEGDHMWQIGLTVELPIMDQNQGPIAEAEAHRNASAARFIELQAKVVGEIDRVVAVYHAMSTNLTELQSVSTAEKTQYDTVSAQFNAGASDRLELLNAQLEYSTAALSELDAQSKLQQAAGDLENAVQQPMELIRPSVFESSPLTAKENQP